MNIVSKDLSQIQVKKIEGLLKSYKNLFSTGDKDLGKTNVVKHKIRTRTEKPIRLLPRQLPLAKREVAEKIIQNMANDGIIEESNSLWSAPVVLSEEERWFNEVLC